MMARSKAVRVLIPLWLPYCLNVLVEANACKSLDVVMKNLRDESEHVALKEVPTGCGATRRYDTGVLSGG